jgi:hypothetical protein
MIKHMDTEVLRIAYAESGAADGTPVLLLHGFPYDIHAYDAVALALLGLKDTLKIERAVLAGYDWGGRAAAGSEAHHRFFGSAYERRVLPAMGHNLPQETPLAFAAAVLALI